MNTMAATTAVRTSFSRYQKVLLGILAFLQFTVILDFMIISPLGAIVMPSLGISPQQFGFAVSSYAFSAAVSGFLAAGFADRFDRKRLLLFFYFGFMLGTLLCGLATTFPLLLMARIVTGLFGGVIGSVVFAITTDLFPLEMRGRVMGVISTAFAASQVFGLPAGLYLTSHWDWHAPFLAIITVGVPAGVMIMLFMQPVVAHLALKQEHSSHQHHCRATLSAGIPARHAVADRRLHADALRYDIHRQQCRIELRRTAVDLSGHRHQHRFCGPAGRQGQRQLRQVPYVLLRKHRDTDHGAHLDEYRSCTACLSHRAQRHPVRRYLLADDPVSGADLGYPGAHQTGSLQCRQRFFAATRGRPVGRGGGLADRATAGRHARPL
jgi:hypothetical protein